MRRAAQCGGEVRRRKCGEQVGERVHYCGPAKCGNAAPGAVKHLQKKAHGSTAGLGYTTAQRERGGDDRHGVGVRHSGGSTNRARLKGRRHDVGARSHGWRRKASDRLTEGRRCRRKQ
jgi:hypothetical protein